jgi:hypothetical protein
VSFAPFLDDHALLAVDLAAAASFLPSTGDGQTTPHGDEVLRLVVTGPLGFSARLEPVDALILIPTPVPVPQP